MCYIFVFARNSHVPYTHYSSIVISLAHTDKWRKYISLFAEYRRKKKYNINYAKSNIAFRSIHYNISNPEGMEKSMMTTTTRAGNDVGKKKCVTTYTKEPNSLRCNGFEYVPLKRMKYRVHSV